MSRLLRAFLGEKQPLYNEGHVVHYKKDLVFVHAFCSETDQYLVQFLTSAIGHVFVCTERDFITDKTTGN